MKKTILNSDLAMLSLYFKLNEKYYEIAKKRLEEMEVKNGNDTRKSVQNILWKRK